MRFTNFLLALSSVTGLVNSFQGVNGRSSLDAVEENSYDTTATTLVPVRLHGRVPKAKTNPKKTTSSREKTSTTSSSSTKKPTITTSSTKITTTSSSTKKPTTTTSSAKITTTSSTSSKKTTTSSSSKKITTTSSSSMKKPITTTRNTKITTTSSNSKKITTTSSSSSTKKPITTTRNTKITTTSSSSKKITTTSSSKKAATTSINTKKLTTFTSSTKNAITTTSSEAVAIATTGSEETTIAPTSSAATATDTTNATCSAASQVKRELVPRYLNLLTPDQKVDGVWRIQEHNYIVANKVTAGDQVNVVNVSGCSAVYFWNRNYIPSAFHIFCNTEVTAEDGKEAAQIVSSYGNATRPIRVTIVAKNQENFKILSDAVSAKFGYLGTANIVRELYDTKEISKDERYQFEATAGDSTFTVGKTVVDASTCSVQAD